MAKRENTSKGGFVIKLSCETVQKLAEEELKSKKNEEHLPVAKDISDKDVRNVASENKTEPKLNTLQASEKRDASKVDLDNNSNKQIVSAPETIIETNTATKSNESNSKSADSDSNSWGDYAPYITYEGEDATYTDPSTQQKYTWNKVSSTWEAKPGQSDVTGREYSYEDDTHIYTEPDGSKFFWDVDRKAWIPKVDDDFLAHYQMSYGFVDNATKEDEKKDEAKKEAHKKETAGIKRKNEPQWFQASDDTNTKVYVSNLPQELTEEEFVTLMQKCGLVERDAVTQKMKVKLYMDKEHNCFKGDALCTYIKIESVDLALKLIDGSDYKGHKIKVERANFQLKGEYNPALKPKKKKKKELEKIRKMQQKLFDWRPEKFIGERSKHERIVIIKNLFHPSDFDKDVQLILDYQQDLREECSKCGEVRKVVIYDRHPEGVAQVTMKDPEQADAAVQLINCRWFGKRQITAEIWDGRTKYRIAETEAQIGKRIDKWDEFLEGKDEPNKNSEGAEKKEGSAVE
ncbi:HIV Tat-specific factor 1 [Hyposmocoma kahamanoa]|uniref:HIV Tat-specific factor 1 n=1 Tax=Hyposmocoma kahamanoa TaxID=1477025 RepID=UPI000E6D97C2|nr:HIV Tat-specific factor 1 [Hyposmocoma kahamanoa]